MKSKIQIFICDLVKILGDDNNPGRVKVELPQDFIDIVRSKREETGYRRTVFYMNVLQRNNSSYIDTRIVSSVKQLSGIRNAESYGTNKVYELTKKSKAIVLPKQAVKQVGLEEKADIVFDQNCPMVFGIWPHGSYVPQEKVKIPLGRKVNPGAGIFVCTSHKMEGVTYEENIK